MVVAVGKKCCCIRYHFVKISSKFEPPVGIMLQRARFVSL